MIVHQQSQTAVFEIDDVDSVTFSKDVSLIKTPFYNDTIRNTIEIIDTLQAISRINNANGFGNTHVTIPFLPASQSYTNNEFPQNIKRGLMLCCHIEIEGKLSTYVEFGKGKDNYRCGYIRVTDDSVFYCITKGYSGTDAVQDKFAHQLSISSYLNIILSDNDGTFTLNLTTLDGEYSCSFLSTAENNGDLRLTCGQDVKNVIISATCNRFMKPIWIFGDSYFAPSMLLGGLESLGFGDCYINALPGQGSPHAFEELEKSLNFGFPSLIVWCLGMNDDFNTFAKYVEEVKLLASDKGIEVVFYTPPTCKLDKSEHINYVRTSGYRYIDAYSAVGSSPSWYDGYLRTDGVHPTIRGSNAIANQMLIDVPELLNWGMRK